VALFGRRRRVAEAAAAAAEPVELVTPEFIQLIGLATVETAAKQERAIADWGLGSGERWSADLAAGTISFDFADRTLTGPVQVVGSYAHAAGTWLWGWANESLPAHVRTASEAVRAAGAEPGLAALATGELQVPPELADDPVAVGVHVSGLAGFYRSPGERSDVYLGLAGFEVRGPDGP
jgi:hypothetical protein